MAEIQLQALEGLAFLVKETFQCQFDGVYEEDELPCRGVLPQARGVAQEHARIDVHLHRLRVLDARVHRYAPRDAGFDHLPIPLR